jgi:hypothetical protein
VAVERTVEERELTDLSTSRVMVANKCGLAFKYRYVDRLPAPYDSGSALFGNAVHDGVAEWYEPGPTTEDNKHRHKELELPMLVAKQWPRLLPPVVWEDVQALLELDAERQAVAEAIRLRRPQIKKPEQTKDYLNSEAQKAFAERQVEMLLRIEKLEEVKWPKDEDPFKAYTKSLNIAERLQRQWQPLPRPLAVEEPFRLEFEGFVLRGAIDQVRHDPNLQTGEWREPRVVDIKTGRNPLTQMEAFVQTFVYNEAVRQIENLPATDLMEFWLARHEDQRGRTKVQRGRVDPKRHGKLALRILNGVGRRDVVQVVRFQRRVLAGDQPVGRRRNRRGHRGRVSPRWTGGMESYVLRRIRPVHH